MLSKADVKYINSLQNKKYRKTERAFFVEGYKNVQELLLSDYEILKIYCSEKYLNEIKTLAEKRNLDPEIVSESQLNSIGTLETNNSALAIARIKNENQEITIGKDLIIALDGINDPGNLGTIIRIADWYGIKNIICSPDTVDLYNPKVINATKGSFTRVNVVYEDLSQFFSKYKNIPVMAAAMDGIPIYSIQKSLPLILLMGSEANGINPDLLKTVNTLVTIPRKGKSESLNVGVATGILVDRLLC